MIKDLHSRTTPHSSYGRVMGMSFVSYIKKNVRDISLSRERTVPALRYPSVVITVPVDAQVPVDDRPSAGALLTATWLKMFSLETKIQPWTLLLWNINFSQIHKFRHRFWFRLPQLLKNRSGFSCFFCFVLFFRLNVPLVIICFMKWSKIPRNLTVLRALIKHRQYTRIFVSILWNWTTHLTAAAHTPGQSVPGRQPSRPWRACRLTDIYLGPHSPTSASRKTKFSISFLSPSPPNPN